MQHHEATPTHQQIQRKQREGFGSESELDAGLSMQEGPDSAQINQLQAAANASPQVQQLKSLQAGITASPQVQATAQRMAAAKQFSAPSIQRKKEDKNGLPGDLQSGIEGLSGMSMGDVKVHYNSSKPAQMQAHAYAQGNDIYVASGQEKHLPHEAWHVVQQKQGRVKPTTVLGGENINDDSALEKEADAMGAKAMQQGSDAPKKEWNDSLQNHSIKTQNVQLQSNSLQFKKVKPAGSKELANTSLVWLDKDTTLQGHLFEIEVKDTAQDKETLIAEITKKVEEVGKDIRMGNWVTSSGKYDKSTELGADPFRLRVKGKHGAGNTPYSIEAHFGGYNHGYIVNVRDGGDNGEMEARNQVSQSGRNKNHSFSNQHHDRNNNKLMDDTKIAANDSLSEEQKLDASTKLIGEGARFEAVKKHQGNLTDNSKFFYQKDDLNKQLRWITFKDLWLTWSATFGKGFGIKTSLVKEKLSKGEMTRIAVGGNGTEASNVGNGAASNITEGRDYCLEDDAAAITHDTKAWKNLEIGIEAPGKSLNSTERGKVESPVGKLDGVVFSTLSKSGKTLNLTVWDEVSQNDIEAVLPDWAVKKKEKEKEEPKDLGGMVEKEAPKVKEAPKEKMKEEPVKAKAPEKKLKKEPEEPPLKEIEKEEELVLLKPVEKESSKKEVEEDQTKPESSEKSKAQGANSKAKAPASKGGQGQKNKQVISKADAIKEIEKFGGKKEGNNYVLAAEFIGLLIAMGLFYYFFIA